MKPYRILLPFSWFYGMIVTIRNAFFENKIFRSERVKIPVISVGNMTTGGTGKTPIVALIASIVQDRGVRVAIVSRGYARRSTGLVLVSDGSRRCADADRSGDEPHQLAVNLPGVAVIVDEQRARGARYAQDELHSGCVILDDGFQHRAIDRSCDLVLIDGERDLFSMPMLPAGHRREPFRSLARADAFIITKCTDATDTAGIRTQLHVYNGRAPVFTSSYVPEAIIDSRTELPVPASATTGKSAAAFCGIGNPESFERSCRSMGITVVSFHPFADHHRYSERDYEMLEKARRASGADLFLTTEKDAHRVAGNFHTGAPVCYVKMRACIHETDALKELIDHATHLFDH
jgi:tetraacyldisaccharide 4'-kinase